VLLVLVVFRVRIFHMLIDAIIVKVLEVTSIIAIFQVTLVSLLNHIQPAVSLFRVGLLFHGKVYHVVVVAVDVFVSGKIVSRVVTQMSVRGP
jgi:hypothetical protein